MLWTDTEKALLKSCTQVEVLDAKHPMSLGASVYVFTNNPGAPESERAFFNHFKENLFHDAKGYYVHYPIADAHLIFIDVFESNKLVTKGRMIGLVCHEAIHCVDHMFDLCGVSIVDSEFRAYHCDMIVESIFSRHSLRDLLN